jgi:hypothetical protein
MSFKNLLLERLKRQPIAQFDEVQFRLENSYSGLRSQISAGAAISQRAIQLIRFLEQDPEGLDRLVEQLGITFTVPCAAIVELENLLQRAKIPEDTVRCVFDDYLGELEDQADWEQSDYASKPLWECLFDDLLDPVWMGSSEQHHLLQFISRLVPYSASHSLHLRSWVQKTAAALDIPPPSPRMSHVGTSRDKKPQPYLLLALSPGGNYYSLQAWFRSGPGKDEEIYAEKLGFTIDDLPKQLSIILKKPPITKACWAGNPPVLEFFLPIGLLNCDPDQWQLPGEKSPLSTLYGLVVRPGERLWDKRWIVNWGRYWSQHCGTLCEAANHLRTVWLARAATRRYSVHLRTGRWIFCLHFVPHDGCFEALLDAGVAILLWPRRRITQAALSELRTQMAERTIQELPEWLRQWRQDYWEAHRKTGPLSLLWDDPYRLPDYQRPLPLHPDF